MKRASLTFIVIFSYFSLFAQKEAQHFKEKELQNKDLLAIELKSELAANDFSPLFTRTDNSVVYGFIGDNYERIRVKLITVGKASADTYNVYGKSMVKQVLRDFHGTITISNVRKAKIISQGINKYYKDTGIKGQYVLFGNYRFYEDKKQNQTGVFEGVMASKFYIDKDGQIKYDDINAASDNYTNNQFAGEWRSYKANVAKTCNWGDFRIPDSGDLDTGAGEFSPNKKYLANGWQTLSDLMASDSKDEHAKQVEQAQWWK